jgi:hypothetical protein
MKTNGKQQCKKRGEAWRVTAPLQLLTNNILLTEDEGFIQLYTHNGTTLEEEKIN